MFQTPYFRDACLSTSESVPDIININYILHANSFIYSAIIMYTSGDNGLRGPVGEDGVKGATGDQGDNKMLFLSTGHVF